MAAVTKTVTPSTIHEFRATLSSQPPSPPQHSGVGPGRGNHGKAIDRLTADNDRLRRELRAEKAAREEADERLRSSKAIIDSLRSREDNLNQNSSSNQFLLERRDRKIAELKEQHTAEITRRQSAEQRARDATALLDSTLAEAKKSVAQAQEHAAREQANASTYKDGFTRLRGHVNTTEKAQRTQNKQHLERLSKAVTNITALESVCDNQRRELERSEESVEAMKQTLNRYKKQNAAMDRLQQEMEEVRDRMHWVMRLQQSREE